MRLCTLPALLYHRGIESLRAETICYAVSKSDTSCNRWWSWSTKILNFYTKTPIAQDSSSIHCNTESGSNSDLMQPRRCMFGEVIGQSLRTVGIPWWSPNSSGAILTSLIETRILGPNLDCVVIQEVDVVVREYFSLWYVIKSDIRTILKTSFKNWFPHLIRLTSSKPNLNLD